jgi:hypothetical protein
LRSTGLHPVKVRPGQKDPFPEWDPRKSAHLDHEATIREFQANPNINIGALFFGKLVDIDIDTNDPALLAALDYFLPKTPYVWGRKSKPGSHRAYSLHDDFDRGVYGSILRFIKSLNVAGRSYSVEVRGGKPENGLFTVMPGSFRSDCGETVEWEEEFDPTVSGTYVSADMLLKQLRLACATALLAAYYGPGVRNDMSLAISGLMWRIRNSTLVATGQDEEPEEGGPFFLTRADAESLFNALTQIADDNAGDSRQRVLNFKNSWEKLDRDANAKVTGGKALAELIGAEGPQVVKAVYRLLSDNEGIEQLEALAEQFTMWYGQGVVIDTQMVDRGLPIPWMTKDQASNSLAGKKIKFGEKAIPLSAILFGTALIPRVYGLTFDPSDAARIVDTEQGPMVNQWRGFTTEPCSQMVTDEEVAPFLSYIQDVVADGDPKAANWVLAWCADMLQQPAAKPGTALVLVGVQGAGKTFLGEGILGPIVGKAHYVQMNSIATLTNKFNQLAANKVFVQCDEAIHSYQRDVAAQLKSLITDTTLTVEPKGINSFKLPNHMHVLFTSNEESTAIFIDPSPHERRFTVLKVSNRYAKDVDYWENFRAWTALSVPKIMRWLLDYKYDRKLILRPFDSQAKRNIQRIGVDPEISWIVSRIAAGFPLSERSHEHWWYAYHSNHINDTHRKRDTLLRDKWPDLVLQAALENDFRSFVRAHGKTVYSGNIMSNIRRALPEGSITSSHQMTVEYNDPRHGQLTKSRVRMYTFPTADAILAHLRTTLGPMVDQMLDEIETDEGEAPAVQEVEEF